MFLNQAFRTIINDSTTGYNASEILSKLCDILLKKGSKVDVTETEEKINDIMILFKYIDDKDLFQKYYSSALSKRLIFESSLSDDLETMTLTKLKVMTCSF